MRTAGDDDDAQKAFHLAEGDGEGEGEGEVEEGLTFGRPAGQESGPAGPAGLAFPLQPTPDP